MASKIEQLTSADITSCRDIWDDNLCAYAEGHHDLPAFAQILSSIEDRAISPSDCQHVWGYVHYREDEDEVIFRIHQRRTPKSRPFTVWRDGEKP